MESIQLENHRLPSNSNDLDAAEAPTKQAFPQSNPSPLTQPYASTYDHLNYPINVQGITACSIGPAEDNRKVFVQQLGSFPDDYVQPCLHTPGFAWINVG